MAEDVILCPGVPPLYCKPTTVPPRGDYGWAQVWTEACNRAHKEKSYKTVAAKYTKDGGVPGEFYKPPTTSYGGVIKIGDSGCKVDSKFHSALEYKQREATFWACFMFSKKTLDLIGGWNAYPGRWGSQEIGLALRAKFAKVPIYAVRDVIVGHRYAVDKYHASKRGGKHSFRSSETTANSIYAHSIVFDEATIDGIFKPLWIKNHGEKRVKDAMNRIQADDLLAGQEMHYKSTCKKLTDEEFLAEHGLLDQLPRADDSPSVQAHSLAARSDVQRPAKTQAITADDVTAIMLHYKRPVNLQRSIDALRTSGITNVWVWCNGRTDPPSGATRVFTDTDNGRTWPRWAIASLAPTKYVLHIDDDAEITEKGMAALIDGINRYPDRPVGLFGFSIEPPYDSYMKRKYAWSHEIKADTEVDILYPKGVIWPRDMMQEIYGRADLWQRMRRECAGVTRGDDFIAYVALSMCGKPAPVVVATDGKGVIEHVRSAGREDKGDCLAKQPEYKLKRATMPIWREMGYEPIGMKESMNEPSEEYLARVATVESLGGAVKQNPIECGEMFRILKENPPRTFLEVGSHYGGTLYVFAGACKPGAKIICVDDGRRPRGRKCLKRVIKKLGEEGYDITWVRGSSHDKNTILEATKLCGARSADFIFIDGDHSAKGVLADYRDYRGLMKPGGLMGFHDINTLGSGCKVHQSWPKIKEGHEFYEIDGGPYFGFGHERKLGIGVVIAP